MGSQIPSSALDIVLVMLFQEEVTDMLSNSKDIETAFSSNMFFIFGRRQEASKPIRNPGEYTISMFNSKNDC